MSTAERWRIRVQGVVQGVGFRPFVYGLATRHGLAGFVSNNSDGVHIEVEGGREALEGFRAHLETQPPPLAHIDTVSVEAIAAMGATGFVIHDSVAQAGPTTSVSPDMATCDDCLRELFDQRDRRYRYPFINCTNCGPRYTIIRDIPYDRPLTTMAAFPMCAQCDAEYHDPLNRRFHAQPNACSVCGPMVWLERSEAGDVALRANAASAGTPSRNALQGENALRAVRESLAAGQIAAIKGVGGFHLACDGTNADAVRELRRRKARGAKPFALMARDLEQVREYAKVSEEEGRLLTGRERPIVLLRGKPGTALAADVAPGTALLGFMLPYSPLHHLILGDRPLVMTSGNLSDEPIARGNDEAITRLASLADVFLLHNRDIHVVCDDSVVRVDRGREVPMRRSRGYAPLPVRLRGEAETVLAVGAELKSTFCLTKADYAYLSPHIGDMENLETLEAMERGLAHFRAIFRCGPVRVMCDLHPGYLSTRWAHEFADKNRLPLIQVQHHYAHVVSLLAEHGRAGETILGISFDGTGYGTDGAIWGGEILLADAARFERVAHLKYVPLPGGDAAVKRAYRMALAHLHAAGVPWDDDLPCVAATPAEERGVLRRQLETGLQCVNTSSMGRLFDAVASLAGVCHVASYEAQAAIELEMQAGDAVEGGYAFAIGGEAPIVVDPAPVVQAVVRDVRARVRAAVIAARFHAGVAASVVEVCTRLAARGAPRVAGLTGGVFQNVRLLRETREQLERAGFEVLTHRVVPANDGGLSLGQAVVGLGGIE
jgi:hydrogenase maturation protein HypF